MGLKAFFCTLSGDDYGIIRKCSSVVKRYFTSVGVLVAIISLLCFTSFLLLFVGLIESMGIAFFLALFFAWMITNIYLLLLYTLSTSVPAEQERPPSVISPNVLKYGFIIFIAIIVSKPLESMIYSDTLNKNLAIYKSELKEKYTQLADACFKQEMTEILKILETDKNLIVNSPELSAQLEKHLAIVQSKEQEKTQSIAQMNYLISKSGFYIQGIIILSTRYLDSWLITLFVVFIFLSPILLKHLVVKESDYYKIKYSIETQLVAESTNEFLKIYNELMHTRFGEKYSWQDFKEDPLPAEEMKVVYTEKELIDSIYHA